MSRDFVAVADQYAKEAADPKNDHRFGKWVRLAAQRYIRDRKRAEAKNPPFVFDPEQAARACRFLENLPHVEGKWDTATIVLHPSDVWFVVQLFGFRNPDGTRRFTSALKGIARKNAKSTIAAGIGLYCELCEDEEGPQVVSAATTGRQARIVFDVARKMVEKTSAMREALKCEAFANSIACYRNGGSFKPINSKASTQDGLNPSTAILDEVHAQKTHDLLNVLRSAAGARRQPLFLFTTTEGYANEGPWPELRQFAFQILEGVVEADHFLAVYYSLDEEDKETGKPADDDFDESKWIKANPLLEVNPILLREIRKEAAEAKVMPGRHAEFRIKRLNRPSSVAGGAIVLHKWKLCANAVDLEALKKVPCYGGLDLASVSDLASFRLVWHLPDGSWATHGFRFVPIAAVRRRGERGLIPYEAWVRSGLLIEAGNEAIDYQEIRKVIKAADQRFNLQAVGYDPWNAKSLTLQLHDEDGIKMIPFIQGPKSYHPAIQELERAYSTGQLSHGGDPVLNWNAANLVYRLDANENKAPDKRRASEKIDDMVALLMGIGTAMTQESTAKRYTVHFV